MDVSEQWTRAASGLAEPDVECLPGEIPTNRMCRQYFRQLRKNKSKGGCCCLRTFYNPTTNRMRCSACGETWFSNSPPTKLRKPYRKPLDPVPMPPAVDRAWLAGVMETHFTLRLQRDCRTRRASVVLAIARNQEVVRRIHEMTGKRTSVYVRPRRENNYTVSTWRIEVVAWFMEAILPYASSELKGKFEGIINQIKEAGQ